MGQAGASTQAPQLGTQGLYTALRSTGPDAVAGRRPLPSAASTCSRATASSPPSPPLRDPARADLPAVQQSSVGPRRRSGVSQRQMLLKIMPAFMAFISLPWAPGAGFVVSNLWRVGPAMVHRPPHLRQRTTRGNPIRVTARTTAPRDKRGSARPCSPTGRQLQNRRGTPGRPSRPAARTAGPGPGARPTVEAPRLQPHEQQSPTPAARTGRPKCLGTAGGTRSPNQSPAKEEGKPWNGSETTGRTVEERQDAALDQLGVDRARTPSSRSSGHCRPSSPGPQREAGAPPGETRQPRQG